MEVYKRNFCLLWRDKARAEENTYMWVLVCWKTKSRRWGIYTFRIHWVARGTGTPKDRDDVKSREVWECEGWVCDLEAIDAPSIFKWIRKAAAFARRWPTLNLRCEENVTRRWNWLDCAKLFLFIITEKARAEVRKWDGVGVMKDKEMKLEDVKTPHTLGWVSCIVFLCIDSSEEVVSLFEVELQKTYFLFLYNGESES